MYYKIILMAENTPIVPQWWQAGNNPTPQNTAPTGAGNTIMPNTTTPIGSPTTPPATNFLGDTPNAQKQEDLYNDFFHEKDDGTIATGAKAKKSPLETAIKILKPITILVIVWVLLMSAHVFMRNIKDSSFLESYPFICPYINYGVDAPEDKGCKTITSIKADYLAKNKNLNEEIAKKLTQYLPIKVGVNIIHSSPERTFAIDTFSQKPHINKIIETFEQIKSASQYIVAENIECSGLAITQWSTLTSQCVIYGGPIGAWKNSDQWQKKTIQSSRLMALHFIENLANTNKSSFIVKNPPTILPIEVLARDEQLRTGFSTRTTLSIQLRYISSHKKP